MKFNRSTLKTVFGYYLTLLEKWLGKSLKRDKLQSIFNYLPISSHLTTSGQPTAEQFKTIANNGFKLVINLAPHGTENAVDNEADIVTSLGMQYINIPVNFDDPQQQDFEQFAATMEASKGNKIWVHCAANMRVSCFVFLYRTTILGENSARPEIDLKKIWEPFGIWQSLISRQ